MALFGYKKRGNFLEVVTGQLTRLHWALELATNIHQVSQCPEKASTRAFSLLKAPTSACTIENLLRHYAKQTFNHFM